MDYMATGRKTPVIDRALGKRLPNGQVTTTSPAAVPTTATAKSTPTTAPTTTSSLSSSPSSSTPSYTHSSVIDERVMEQTFQNIVNCIHLDDPLEDDRILLNSTSVSGLSSALNGSPVSKSIHVQSSPSLASSPIGHGNSKIVLAHSPGHMAAHSAYGERDGSTRTSSTAPSPSSDGKNGMASCKSFLDDDWLSDRVEHDEIMAKVAGGLVKKSLEPPKKKDLSGRLMIYRTSSESTSSMPPGDYVCKLCCIPGHWLKDCSLFEPRRRLMSNGNDGLSTINSLNTGIGHHRRISSSPSSSNHATNHRSSLPPGNYVCRLCNICGHWIDQCPKFQPKYSGILSIGSKDSDTNNGFRSTSTNLHNGNHGNNGANSNSGGGGNNGISIPRGIPPSGYICNLCHRSGHWIQQCSEFQPYNLGRRR